MLSPRTLDFDAQSGLGIDFNGFGNGVKLAPSFRIVSQQRVAVVGVIVES